MGKILDAIRAKITAYQASDMHEKVAELKELAAKLVAYDEDEPKPEPKASQPAPPQAPPRA